MKLYNKYHKDAPENAVYIGRPSFWGNPYTVGKDGTRDEVVAMYAKWLDDRLKESTFLDRLKTLAKSSGLVCFCAPRRCHGHVLIEAMKRHRLIPVEAGDSVQWLCNGAYQFAEPRKVVNVASDPAYGVYAFVEDGTTGIRIEELFLWTG